jgi:hypothetical protein
MIHDCVSVQDSESLLDPERKAFSLISMPPLAVVSASIHH